MKRFSFCLLPLLLATVLAGLCACSGIAPDPVTDSAPKSVCFVLPAEETTVTTTGGKITAVLSNGLGVSVMTDSSYVIRLASGEAVKTLSCEKTTVLAKQSAVLKFEFGSLKLTAGQEYQLELSVSHLVSGARNYQKLVYPFRCADKNNATDVPVKPSSSEPSGDTPTQDDPQGGHDLYRDPVSSLTEAEAETLAKELFKTYVPCSFGVFSKPEELSSPALWSSVEALNDAVDGDSSARSHTLADAEKKIQRYFPGASFDPSKVRVYDAETKTFLPSGQSRASYQFESYRIVGETIEISYKDADGVEDPQSYVTVLKHSADSGYFCFVKTERRGGRG